MKRIVSAGMLVAAFVLLAAAVAFGKPSAVVLPETGSIAQIQLDMVKMDAERLGKGQLEGFLEHIQAAVPVARIQAAQVGKPDRKKQSGD